MKDEEENSSQLRSELMILKERVSSLDEENRRLRSVLAIKNDIISSSHGFLAVTMDDRLIFSNPELEYLLGYSKHELESMDIYQVIREDYRHLVRNSSNDSIVGEGMSSVFEIPMLKKTGEERWVEIRPSVLKNNGHSMNVVAGFDITARKYLENNLRISEEKYKSVLEQSPNNIYLVDQQTMKIIEANRTLQDLLGYSEDELLGMSPYDFIAHDEKDIDNKIGELPTGNYKIVGERKYRKKNGECLDVEVSANIIDYGEKKVIAVVSWDITELKRIQREMIELNEVLKLTARITRHDIRNKLAVAYGMLGLLKEGNSNDRVLIEESYNAVKKGIEITRRMNELETLMTKRGETTPFDLREVIETIVKDHPIKYAIRGECTCETDASIYSVIENIVGNAVLHGQTDRLEIDLENDGQECRVQIADFGIGISSEIIEDIFDESFSFGEYKGTGLGLYIVKRVVGRYGGEVSVRMNEPKGTIFELKLPVIDVK